MGDWHFDCDPIERKNKVDDYIKQAIRTEAPVTPELIDRMIKCVRLIHSAFGLSTEIGEFIDALKKHIFYGAPLDKVNLKEEMGDKFWYLAIGLDELGVISFDEIMETNIAKLRKRYPDKFTEYNALNRNLEEERKVLDKATEWEKLDPKIKAKMKEAKKIIDEAWEKENAKERTGGLRRENNYETKLNGLEGIGTEENEMECIHCDGCGWYEGGPTIKTTCEYCHGTGKENQFKFNESNRNKLWEELPPEVKAKYLKKAEQIIDAEEREGEISFVSEEESKKPLELIKKIQQSDLIRYLIQYGIFTDAKTNKVILLLDMDLTDDSQYHFARNLNKLLFHVDAYKDMSNQLGQKLISFDEERKPLKTTQYNVPGAH